MQPHGVSSLMSSVSLSMQLFAACVATALRKMWLSVLLALVGKYIILGGTRLRNTEHVVERHVRLATEALRSLMILAFLLLTQFATRAARGGKFAGYPFKCKKFRLLGNASLMRARGKFGRCGCGFHFWEISDNFDRDMLGMVD